jgi:methylmalonyl-CoA mutase C-terminal domain/subunit
MSILSGAHNYVFPRVMTLLKEAEVDDVLVIGGGVIPKGDIPGLKACGIAEIFTPGASIKATVAYVQTHLLRKVI